MKKVVALIHEIFEDLELMYPVIRIKESGIQAVIAGEEKETVYHGKHGYPCKSAMELLSQNTVYERYFMATLREEVAYLHETFDHLPPIRISNEMTLLEFNDLYIAPQSGHDNARDYYHACSSGRLIHNIAVDCHILFSLDDPIVDCSIVNFKEISENVNILITENGGHLGFLGTPGQKGGFYWMDSVLLQWLFENKE